MNKKTNGNWEDDKEICYRALRDGYDIDEILEMVYKYGRADGRQEAFNQAIEMTNGNST